MKPRSNTLFHFTEMPATLKLILSNGFWPKYCQEDVSWLRYKDFSYVAYPMVCFCDIPLSRISEHVGFYGYFGLGLTREWALRNGLNPVFYVSNNSPISELFREFNSLSDDGSDSVLNGKLKNNLRHFLMYTKPSAGTMPHVDGERHKDFYQESEWRYVLKDLEVQAYMTEVEFEDSEVRTETNEVTLNKRMLKFKSSDIRYIFVNLDSDVADMVDFILLELGWCSEEDRKILVSKIVSFESISADI